MSIKDELKEAKRVLRKVVLRYGADHVQSCHKHTCDDKECKCCDCGLEELHGEIRKVIGELR